MRSQPYFKTYEVIWADIDPNRHMRHSVYNDYAAQTRVAMFGDFSMPMNKIAAMGLGPILFREETTFMKEIELSEEITVTCEVKAMRSDGARWTIIHKILKEDDRQAAQIVVDGAWLDLQKRKLGVPSKELLEASLQFPRTDDFSWIDK